MAWRKWSLENIEAVRDDPGIYFIRQVLFRHIEGEQYYGKAVEQGLRTRLLQHWRAKPGSTDYFGFLPREFDVEYHSKKSEIDSREAYLIGKYQPWQNIQHRKKGSR